MDTTTIRETREGVAPTRELRGLDVYRRGGIERISGDEYLVPGCSGGEYLVSLDAESCTCPDHRRRHLPCKHVYAAMLYRAWLRRSARVLASALADGE